MKNIVMCGISMLMALTCLGSITVDQEVLVRGTAMNISVDQATDTIKVTYRPNSQVEKIQYLTSPTPVKSFAWTPQNAGVVALNGKGESTTVSVRFPGVSGKRFICYAISWNTTIWWCNICLPTFDVWQAGRSNRSRYIESA